MNLNELTNTELEIVKNILEYAKTIGYVDYKVFSSEDILDNDAMLQALTKREIENILSKLEKKNS